MRYLLVAASVLLSACGKHSGYRDFYQAYEGARALPEVELLQQRQMPELYSSADLARDVQHLRSKNYVPIGQSAFNGAAEGDKQIVAQARRVGATLVLLSSAHTATLTSTVPLFVPTTSTTQSSGSIYGGGGYGTYSGSTTTRGSTVVPITMQQERYDQTAVFFVKSTRRLKFGLYVADLTPEERVAIERNMGAFIEVVVEDTPAFAANILPGDVLIELNGVAIQNAGHARDQMTKAASAGGLCTLKLIRRGEIKSIAVHVGPA